MKDLQRGFLANLFNGVVAKRLTLVETITTQSNQHEFQGTKPIKQLFGLEDRKQIETSFIWIEAEHQSFAADGFISWSNVRKINQGHQNIICTIQEIPLLRQCNRVMSFSLLLEKITRLL